MLISEVPERARKYFEVVNGYAEKLIINGKPVKIIEDFTLEPYNHQWFLSLRCFELSGVELETQDRFSTIALLTILDNSDIGYCLKRDGTAYAEATLTLDDYIKILPFIQKLGLRLVSTHIHSSSPLIYRLLRDYASAYQYSPTYLDPSEVKKIFGRGFNPYADSALSYWKRHRYGWITYPKMSVADDNKIIIELSSHSDRVTVEFRILKLHKTSVIKRFLLFIITWYIFESRLPKQYLRQHLLKTVEIISRIDNKTLRKISLENLIKKIEQFENEILNRYDFYFKIGDRELFKPVYRRL